MSYNASPQREDIGIAHFHGGAGREGIMADGGFDAGNTVGQHGRGKTIPTNHDAAFTMSFDQMGNGR